MQYFISFLEGIITFISPCLLPLLPVYVSYFAAGRGDARHTLKNALGFVFGFTFVFTLMGAFAGTIGIFLRQYQTPLNIVTGMIVILLGLNFLGVFQFTLFRGVNGNFIAGNKEKSSILTAILFGMVFSVGWTPCVGAFLGSALMLASQQGSALKGVSMLLCYSAGLGIPFIISAVLIDKLKTMFDFIKKNYRVINAACGAFLILTGVLMMTGLVGRFLSFLSY